MGVVRFPRPRRVVGQLIVLEVRRGSHFGEPTSMIQSGNSMILILRGIRVQLRAGQKVSSKEFRVLPCLWRLLLMLRGMPASSATKSLREGSLVLPL